MRDMALICITLLIFALGYLVAAGLDRMTGTKRGPGPFGRKSRRCGRH